MFRAQGPLLSLRQLAIDADNITEGMYVSKLDRPWLETPFLFQGFEIRERSEIDLLRQYCNVVYIDIDRGELPDETRKHLVRSQGASRDVADRPVQRMGSRPPSAFRRWLKHAFIRLGMYDKAAAAVSDEREPYPVQTTVRAAEEQARQAYRKLAEHHKDMVDMATVKSEVRIGVLRRAVQPAIESVLRNPNALAWTVFSRKRSNEDYNRSVGTAVWCLLFGRQLGFEREMLDDLAVGGMLLDIGNARIPRSYAATAGAIAPDKYVAVQKHVDLGVEILECSKGVTENVYDMVRCHHERADGSGYPQKLRGNEIPAFGRIAAIADCYDAMTTISPYSPPMAAYDAARELNDMRGKQFATEVVEQFLTTMGMFPVASIVELSDGSVAIVVEQNPGNVLKPKVLQLLDRNRTPLAEPRVIELRDLPVDVTHSEALWIEQGHEHGAFGIDPLRIFKG